MCTVEKPAPQIAHGSAAQPVENSRPTVCLRSDVGSARAPRGAPDHARLVPPLCGLGWIGRHRQVRERHYRPPARTAMGRGMIRCQRIGGQGSATGGTLIRAARSSCSRGARARFRPAQGTMSASPVNSNCACSVALFRSHHASIDSKSSLNFVAFRFSVISLQANAVPKSTPFRVAL